MIKNKELIRAYADGVEIECWCHGWTDWLPLQDMRDSALRAFLGIAMKSGDDEWVFRVNPQDT